MEGEVAEKKCFKAYPIGYFHIDIAGVRTEEGKLHLYVGIDLTSKLAFAQLHDKADRPTAVPYDLHTILSDNVLCRQTLAVSARRSPGVGKVPARDVI